MDEITKYRITGAVIWLTLLIVFVPGWYSDPVDYQQPRSWQGQANVHEDEILPESDSSSVPNNAKDGGLEPERQIEQTTTKAGQSDSEVSRITQVKPPLPQEPAQPVAVLPDNSKHKANPQSDLKALPSTSEIEPDRPADAAEVKKQPQTAPAWLVRVASYNSLKTANQTLGLLETRYQVTIGDFSNENRKVYSVRVGPYFSLAEAEQAKKMLDAELRTQSVIVQIR